MLMLGSILPFEVLWVFFPIFFWEFSCKFGLGVRPYQWSKDNSGTSCLLCAMCLLYIISIDLQSHLVRKRLGHSFWRWGIWGSGSIGNLFKVTQLQHGRLKFKHRCPRVWCLYTFLYLFQGLEEERGTIYVRGIHSPKMGLRICSVAPSVSLVCSECSNYS